MSPPTATLASRSREAQRRDAARRRSAARRRAAVAILGVVLLVVAVVLALPLFRKAVTELTLPLQHEDIIRQQAAEKHLDPALIAAVIYAETKFDPRPSPAGAQGLMQILPQTAEFLAKRSGATTFTISDLSAPQVNIAYGSYYLRYLLDEYGGNKVLALAAYNGGPTRIARLMRESPGKPEDELFESIPLYETRDYVRRVLLYAESYRELYP